MQTSKSNSNHPKNHKATHVVPRSMNQINFAQILFGLLIGICLAFSTNWIPGLKAHDGNFKRFLNPLLNRRLWSSSPFDSEDHASWLNWHKVQLKNPFLSSQDPNESTIEEIDPTSTKSTHQPPSLKDEIKKIINSNKLKLDNFNIIHSSDEL